MSFDFDAYVTAVLWDGGEAAFVLGDGTVRWSGGALVEAHRGAALCAAACPKGGVLTGGDDGRLMRSTPAGAETLAELPRGRWVEAVETSAASGLAAFTSGRELHVRDLADARFSRVFTHEKSVAGLAFEPKGRRLATATYGGGRVWLARIAEQKPTALSYAGSHIAASWSPDGRYLVTAMQDNQLHGWRLSDGKDMRFGGYPAKPRSLAWLADGSLLASSGAQGAVVWPFTGASGPMGKEASLIGADESTLVTAVAGTLEGTRLAAGTADGRVWWTDLRASRRAYLKPEHGPAITALAVTLDGTQLAWGDEEGGAGVAEMV